MDLITIILIVGSLVNGVLLTLCLRASRESADEARRAAGFAHQAELEAACSNAWFGRMASKLDTAIAALPKKRKPRRPTAGKMLLAELPEGDPTDG